MKRLFAGFQVKQKADSYSPECSHRAHGTNTQTNPKTEKPQTLTKTS
jgi:hypothetical protein